VFESLLLPLALDVRADGPGPKMIESYSLTDRGCVRAYNEDLVFTDHSLLLFVVADGMGGHHHGARAAELAVSSVRYYLESSQDRFDVTWPFGYNFELSIDANRLSTSIQIANRQVWRQAEESPEFSGMGTTVAALLISGYNAVVANVGDSRVYLFRKGELSQLTYDDTFLNTALPEHALAPHERLNHPMRNVLTQAAGSKGGIDVHIQERTLQSDDLFLISSDGLHGVVGDAGMRAILQTGENLERTAHRLLQAASGMGAPDNVSCVLVNYSI